MFWALAEKGLAGKRIGVCFDIALWNGRRRDGAWREEVRLVAMRKLKKYRPTKYTSEKADSGWLRNQHVPDKAPPDSPYMAMAGKTGSTIGRCPTRRIRMIRGYRVSGRTPIYS